MRYLASAVKKRKGPRCGLEGRREEKDKGTRASLSISSPSLRCKVATILPGICLSILFSARRVTVSQAHRPRSCWGRKERRRKHASLPRSKLCVVQSSVEAHKNGPTSCKKALAGSRSHEDQKCRCGRSLRKLF